MYIFILWFKCEYDTKSLLVYTLNDDCSCLKSELANLIRFVIVQCFDLFSFLDKLK